MAQRRESQNRIMFLPVREKGIKLWYFSRYLECVMLDVQLTVLFATNSYKRIQKTAEQHVWKTYKSESCFCQ